MPLPPTVNMHVIGHCNFSCRYCYARFAQAKARLSIDDARQILTALAVRGVERVTFAGGEPTLHSELLEMLRQCSALGLVANVVTNGSRIDRGWCRSHFPWLRWLTLSCDSHLAATNDAHGRRPRKRGASTRPVAEHVSQIAAWLHEWNAARPIRARVRLKVNVVVTRENAHEDPTHWLRSLAPQRVKLMQQVVVAGENDDARDLCCSGAEFAAYAARVGRLERDAIVVVAERGEQLHDSYAMIDPKGRFRQSHPEGYVTSEPVRAVGLDAAWSAVGGYDPTVFVARGGRYDAGAVSNGPQAQIIALEGLDGSGKSTVTQRLADALGAPLLSCPPRRLAQERQHADAMAPAERRAWYYRAGRIAMDEAVDQVFAGETVVLDRSPATTAAYAAAERGRVASRADLPADVPMPDRVFLLDVPEEIRLRRIHGRERALTPEEGRLERDHAFRQRVLDGYAALGAVAIAATETPDEIVTAIRCMLG